MNVRVQMEDFDVSREIAAVRAGNPRIGAVASFVGVVRDLNDGSSVAEMTLEHYPGMTEKSIEAIINEARGRWDVMNARVIHRVGTLKPLDQIVLVVVASGHGWYARTARPICPTGASRTAACAAFITAGCLT